MFSVHKVIDSRCVVPVECHNFFIALLRIFSDLPFPVMMRGLRFAVYSCFLLSANLMLKSKGNPILCTLGRWHEYKGTRTQRRAIVEGLSRMMWKGASEEVAAMKIN